MSSNARRTLAWTLALSLAGCALDGEPAHENSTAAPLAPQQPGADAHLAVQVEAAPAGASVSASMALAPQATAPVSAPVDPALPATSSPSTPVVPAAATPAAPAPTAVQPSDATRLSGVVANIGVAHPELGLGGRGTLELTSQVRISELLAGVGRATLAEVAIDVQGNFSAQLPVRGKLLIAEALDATGRVLGGAIVGLPSASVQVAVAPITIESSLALELFLRAAALPCSEQSTSALTALAIDATLLAHSGLSIELAAALDVNVNAEALLDALAKAFVTGHHARHAVLHEAGASVALGLHGGLEALAELNASAAAALSGKLDAKLASRGLTTDLEFGLSADGSGAGVRARAQVAASLALGASLRASIEADASLLPVLFPALHAAAQLEVLAALPTLTADLTLSGANAELATRIRAAGAELSLDVRSATNLADLTSARRSYLEKLYRDRASQGLVLDLLGTTTGIVAGVLDPLLSTVDSLTSQLDAKLALDLDVSAQAGVCTGAALSVELDTSLQGVVATLLDFQAGVRAGLAGGSLPPTLGRPLGDLLATAELVLRLSP